MKKITKKTPYKHRIAIVIFLFTLIPCILLETIYLKNIQQDLMHVALVDHQNDVDSAALLISKNISGLHSKMEYVLNSSSVRSSIAQVNKLSLIQALDFVSVLSEIAGSITAESPTLTVRWYPHLSQTSYGNYCYTLDIFSQEFPLNELDSNFQEIISLNEGQTLWQVRDIARELNNTGTPETRLCLYTQMTNLNGSDCVLELSIPIFQILEPRKSDSVPGSLFAVCLEQNNETVNILLDSAFAAEEADRLIARYRQAGSLAGYDILCAPIPNVANSEVIYILPDRYAKTLIFPQIVEFISVSALILLLIISISFLTSHLLTKRIETENLRMELELLQMRFNPHFLYNTLGAIRHQVRNPDARNSIDSLSHYYRIVLNNGHLIIRIQDEIEMIKEYLSIEKFAYRLDNIEFKFEMDDKISQYTIIKHLLQPIVENALNHGLRPLGRDYNGRLLISAALVDDCICICVTDNGVGMSPENAAKLLSAPAASTSGNGYGVYNVQQRIQVYYGKKYGLQINSTIGVGTTVTLKIPAISSIHQ